MAPKTIEGVSALVAYAAEHVMRHDGMWSEGWVVEDEEGNKQRVTWDAMVHKSLAAALRKIVA